jgi:hypothetical protein
MRRDRAFRDALLCEGVNALLAGDVAAGKPVLRDDINATIGLEGLASATGIAAKRLMRMCSGRTATRRRRTCSRSSGTSRGTRGYAWR